MHWPVKHFSLPNTWNAQQINGQWFTTELNYNPTQNYSRLYIGGIPEYAGPAGCNYPMDLHCKCSNHRKYSTFPFECFCYNQELRNTKPCNLYHCQSRRQKCLFLLVLSDYGVIGYTKAALHQLKLSYYHLIIRYTLYPILCVGDASVGAKVDYDGGFVATNNVQMDVSLPEYSITGLSNLPMSKL